MKRPLFRWQRWLVIHALELLPDGRPRFRQVVVLVARQNGKTELLAILALFWMWIQRVPMVVGTSTKLEYSIEAWETAVELAKSTPELKADIEAKGSLRRTNGQTLMRTPWRSRYRVATANEQGGRSLTIHRLIEDELREHHDYSAHTAAMNAMNAVRTAQAWAITNEGGDRSIVLHDFVDAGLKFIATGDGDYRLGFFGYTSLSGCDLLDLEETAQANPSMGEEDGVSWENIEGEAIRAKMAGGELEAKYRTEVLCQRVRRLTAEPVTLEAWRATEKDVQPDGDPVFFVSAGEDLASAAIVGAAVHEGVPHLKLFEGHAGVSWLTAKIRELHEQYPGARFGAFQAGPVRSWVPVLAEHGIDLRLLSASDASAACAHLQKLANDLAFTHAPSSALVESLKGAERRKLDGGAWVWDWKASTSDLAPIAAATGALWLLESSTVALPMIF